MNHQSFKFNPIYPCTRTYKSSPLNLHGGHPPSSHPDSSIWIEVSIRIAGLPFSLDLGSSARKFKNQYIYIYIYVYIYIYIFYKYIYIYIFIYLFSTRLDRSDGSAATLCQLPRLDPATPLFTHRKSGSSFEIHIYLFILTTVRSLHVDRPLVPLDCSLGVSTRDVGGK